MSIQPACDVPLARHTTFALGGTARHYIEVNTDEELEAAIRWAEQAGVGLYVLGGGSNLVVADSGVEGLVLKMASTGITIRDHGKTAILSANAGVSWDELVEFAVARELVGLECLSGIPGSVGATPIQNVGAYGQEISQTVIDVTAYDRLEHRTLSLERDACELAYRSSRFKSREPDRYVISNVRFELPRQAPAPVRHAELEASLSAAGCLRPSARDVRAAVLSLRQRKGMLVTADETNQRSAGSFFVNPIVPLDTAQRLTASEGPTLPAYPMADGRVKLSAAWLIEHAGVARGTRDGNVGTSPHHCLVLVAHDQATAVDVVAFAHRIRDMVRARFGVELQPEPNFWGFQDFDRGLPIPG